MIRHNLFDTQKNYIFSFKYGGLKYKILEKSKTYVKYQSLDTKKIYTKKTNQIIWLY